MPLFQITARLSPAPVRRYERSSTGMPAGSSGSSAGAAGSVPHPRPLRYAEVNGRAPDVLQAAVDTHASGPLTREGTFVALGPRSGRGGAPSQPIRRIQRDTAPRVRSL